MKHMNMKRLLSALLALIMAASVTGLCACGNAEEDDPSATGENTEAVDTASAYEQLEKEQFDRAFTILNREDLKEDFYVEKLTSEVLNDAIYERNSVIERDYGVTLEYVYEDDYGKVNSDMSTAVLGGVDDYDIGIGHKYTFTSCAQNNHLMDLGSITSMDLTNPWWDSACYRNLTVEGKTFLMTGDILPSSMMISACLVFNKALNERLDKPEPYDMVREGKWTLDAFNELTADVSIDLDGDGSFNYKVDQYGLTSWMMDISYSMFYGADGMFVTINEDQLPELTYSADRVVEIYEKMYAALITSNAYYVTDASVYPTTYDVFTEGRALYCDETLSKIGSFLADMKEDYGIIPMPKFDELQAEYLSFVNGASGFIAVLKTETTPEFVGTILEGMGAYNYCNVSPNMFEIVTKLKSARDPASAEMVDYIIRNRVYDFGYFFDLSVTNVVRAQLMAKKAELASTLKKEQKSSNSNLDKIIKAFQKGDAK